APGKNNAPFLNAARSGLLQEPRVHRGSTVPYPQHGVVNRLEQPRPKLEHLRPYFVVGIETAKHEGIGWQTCFLPRDRFRLGQGWVAGPETMGQLRDL